VRVNVVQLFFNVKDKKGALIRTRPRTISKSWRTENRRPSSTSRRKAICPYTRILIDSSGSQMRVLEMEKEVGADS